MELDVHDAAALLGKSPRAVRRQLASGVSKGRKRGNRWFVLREALPLDPEARRALRARTRKMRAAVEAALPDAKGPSVEALAPFEPVRGVLHALADIDVPHVAAARARMTSGVECIAAGHYQFLPSDKRAAFIEARTHLAAAVARLYLAEGAEVAAAAATLESEVLPPLAGLIAWVERLAARST